MKKLKIVLYVLAGACFVITVIDAVRHRALSPVYALATAADLCAVAALNESEKKRREAR